MQHDSKGLAILNRVPPDPDTGTGAYLLQGSGQSALSPDGTHRAHASRAGAANLLLVYVLARRGDLNDFSTYLSTFPAPIIRPNYFGDLPGSLPHRFLAWGIFRSRARCASRP